MLIGKHLISNKTNADRKTDAESQPYGGHDSVPGRVHSSASSAERNDTEKPEDQRLINQTALASSEYSQYAKRSVPVLTCRLGGVLGERDFSELF